MTEFRAPVGTRDVLPPESARWERLIALFAAQVERAGYGLVLSPMFEEQLYVVWPLVVFVALRFDPSKQAKDAMNAALTREPCVLEVHEVAGEDCYLVKVRVSSTEALADTLDRIRAMPSVHSTNTTIVLRTILERPLLPH